ncbi:hypothetical protein PsorP6_010717 [Peronosclerospora sorghi]|uniref:Uncharacterized protein n=1 Tax=Peronosclerospora sorghi TaxID=230839 RepID=A0ACC0VWJ2_9STRA|nr:hypothetical protein PsorP6_010717 [Peronosclerospora sorghi]
MSSPTTLVTPVQPVHNSFTVRKRSSPAVKSLPDDVAWLQDIRIEMTTTNTLRTSVQYIIHVSYQPTGSTATTWDVKRTFDQYKWFQKRLVGHLQPKHSCKAECRWLHSTIRKHFPKSTLGSRYPSIVEQRRKALLQLLTTVLASVVNHGNRNCKVMMEAVSQELSSFIVGDDSQSFVGVTPPLTPTTSSEMETSAELRSSFTSSVSSSEEGEEESVDYDADMFTGWSLPIDGHLNLEPTIV